MEQKGKFKLYSSEEVLDMHFGKIGTPRRDDFERSVAASVHANEMAARNPYIPKNVSHPGTTLDEKLKEMGMSVKEFSIRISKPEETVIAVINGKSPITPDMAVAFESVTEIPAETGDTAVTQLIANNASDAENYYIVQLLETHQAKVAMS